MTRFLRFAKRFERMKETLQDQAELEFGKANLAHAAIQAKLSATKNTRIASMANRSQCANGLEFSVWHQYITALQMYEGQLREEVSDAEREVLRCRQEVATAYIEWKKWGKVVEVRQQSVDDWQNRRQQQLADDHAVMQHRGREQ